MKLLIALFTFVRLPVDFLLLTFHYVRGVTWLVFTLLKLKITIGKQTSAAQYFTRQQDVANKKRNLPGWPFGCFTTQTSAGRSACLPGRKYGNLFLFRALCPDTERNPGSPACDTCCLERIQIKQFYWRPPLGRVFGVGVFLVMLWSTIGYGVYQLLPTTQKMKQMNAENFFEKGQEFANQKKYNKARLAYKNAIKQEPKNANIYLELGRCLFELKIESEGIEAYKRAAALDPNLWEANLELARLNMERRAYQAAIRHANSVSEVNSEMAEPFLISAFCLQQQNQSQKAIETLNVGVSKLANDDVKQTQFAANLCFMLQKLERAKELFTRVLELDSDSPVGRVGLANVLGAQSQWDAALEQVDLVLTKDPEHDKALLVRAELFVARKELPQAIDEYEKIIELYPKAPLPRTRLASILYTTGKKNEAAEILQLVLAEYPNYPDALILLSQIHVEQKRFRLAVAHSERIMRIDQKKFIGAQKILARAYLELKKYEEAIEASKLVLEAHPENFTITLGLAYSHHQLGDKDQAIKYYHAAAELNPKSHLPDLYLGTLFTKYDEITQAIASFKTAMAKAPNESKIANNLAMLYIQKGTKEDIAKAYTLANELRKQHEDDAKIVDTFGWVLYHQGEYEEAKKAFTRSTELNSSNPRAHYHLGKILYEQGDFTSAKQSLLKALEFRTNFLGREDAIDMFKEIQGQEQ